MSWATALNRFSELVCSTSRHGRPECGAPRPRAPALPNIRGCSNSRRPRFATTPGGIATLAPAVYLVRKGHFKGRNIAILGDATLGGSLDAGGSAQQGYAMRGSRT